MKPDSTYRDFPAQGSVKKVLGLLEVIGEAREASLADLAARTRLPKSTLMRLLGILVQAGFLKRTAHGRYCVAFKVWRIGATALDQDAIRDAVIPVLRELVSKTSETAHYSVYERGYSVYVEKMDGVHPVRYYTVIGGMSPAYASATGKSLLAWQESAEIERVGAASERMTPNTHVGVDEIVKHMAAIRASGYSVNQGEWREGVWGVAAPIFGRTGAVAAAVGVSGPQERIEPNIGSYADLVREAARILSAQHGALEVAS
jgi:IclR family KDG regulon transcriptional repressor